MDDEDDDRHARAPEPDDVVRLCRALNERGARYRLIGGFAVIAHGGGRFTKDVDLLVGLTPRDRIATMAAAEEVRAMGARRLRRLLAVLLTVFVLLPAMPASAERIASRGEDVDASRPARLAQVREALAQAEVAEALAAQGLSAGEVEQRLAQLSAEDLHRLAANIEQIQAAGNVPNYVWILLAVFLAVSTLAIIF